MCRCERCSQLFNQFQPSKSGRNVSESSFHGLGQRRTRQSLELHPGPHSHDNGWTDGDVNAANRCRMCCQGLVGVGEALSFRPRPKYASSLSATNSFTVAWQVQNGSKWCKTRLLHDLHCVSAISLQFMTIHYIFYVNMYMYKYKHIYIL